MDEVIENQGKLFEYAEEHCPGIDVADFIEAYMKSRTRGLIDAGQAYISTMDAEDLFNYFLKNDKYELKHGKASGGFAPNWIGQFYTLNGYINCPVRKLSNCFRLNLCLKDTRGFTILIYWWLFVRWERNVDLLYRNKCK